MSLNVGRAVVERRTGGGHGATCRTLNGARSGGDGWVARATQRAEKAGNGRRVRHDRAHRHAACAPGASLDVHVEGAAQVGGPIDTRKRRVERAAKESAFTAFPYCSFTCSRTLSFDAALSPSQHSGAQQDFVAVLGFFSVTFCMTVLLGDRLISRYIES